MASLTTYPRSAKPGVPVWVNESPLTLVAEEDVIFTLQWIGGSSLASPAMLAYADGTDVSSTVLTGTTTVSGDVQTLKKLTAMTPGVTYVLEIQCDIGSNTEFRKLLVYAVSRSSEI